MVYPRPEYAAPVLSREKARDALRGFLRDRQREFKGLGLPWDDAEIAEAKFHFRASEMMLGPLTEKSFAGWCARELKIQVKNPMGETTIPFKVNEVQYRLLVDLFTDLAAGVPIRYVILKARQFGISTLIQALEFFFVATQRDTNATTVAHKADATRNLYEMFQRYMRNLKFAPRTKRSNARELVFGDPWDSRIRLETAEAKESGRSATNRILHCSELAFWSFAQKTRLGLVQTVGDYPGTMVFEESTANGMGNVFHKQYELGKTETTHTRSKFYPWHEHSEYRVKLKDSQALEVMESLDAEEKAGVELYGWDAGQIVWRRMTIRDKCSDDILQFHQEYPSNDREAFLTSGRPVFDQDIVSQRLLRAMPLETWRGSLGYHVNN